MVKLVQVPQQCKGEKWVVCVPSLGMQSGVQTALVPARHDPIWKPGPFISAHPCLASAWVLETILRRESDKTPIRHTYYSTPTEQEILR